MYVCSSGEADPSGTQMSRPGQSEYSIPLDHSVGSGTQVSLKITSSKTLTGTIGKEALSLPAIANLVEWKPGAADLALLKKSLLNNKPTEEEAELKDRFLLALCES